MTTTSETTTGEVFPCVICQRMMTEAIFAGPYCATCAPNQVGFAGELTKALSRIKRLREKQVADEGLMRLALEAVGIGRSYQAEAWADARGRCTDHGWHRTDAERMDSAMDALRARLGEPAVKEGNDEPKGRLGLSKKAVEGFAAIVNGMDAAGIGPKEEASDGKA